MPIRLRCEIQVTTGIEVECVQFTVGSKTRPVPRLVGENQAKGGGFASRAPRACAVCTCRIWLRTSLADIQTERQVHDVLRGVEGFNKDGLHHTSTEERTILPSADDLKTERVHHSLIQGIEHFDKNKLEHAETKEPKLPSAIGKSLKVSETSDSFSSRYYSSLLVLFGRDLLSNDFGRYGRSHAQKPTHLEFWEKFIFLIFGFKYFRFCVWTWEIWFLHQRIRVPFLL